MDEYIKRSEVIDLVEKAIKKCSTEKTTKGVLVCAHLRTAVMGLRSADVAPRAGWISVEERLPNDLEWVQVYDGNRRYKILRFEKGIDEDTREKMRTGEIPDPETTGWTKTDGFFMIKRSEQFKAADVFGNNMVPYCWRTEYGDTIFGQNITWWRNLPEPPKGD